MIDTTEFAIEGRSSNPVVAEVVVSAVPSAVFDAWTTAATLTQWLGVTCDIELRVGGPFELYFVEDAPAGTRGSEGCKILGYIPDEMLIVSWNSPPMLAEIRDARTQVGIRFTETDTGTHVRLVHAGMGDGEIWDQNREYFERAWNGVLGALSSHFA